MASESGSAANPVASPLPASQPSFKPKAAVVGGKALPPRGNAAPVTGAGAAANVDATTAPGTIPRTAPPPPPPPPAKAAPTRDLQVMVDQLNKYLNDSGRPNQYRINTTGGTRVIQEINPANGQVIGQFSAAEFPALALGLGVSGLWLNSNKGT